MLSQPAKSIWTANLPVFLTTFEMTLSKAFIHLHVVHVKEPRKGAFFSMHLLPFVLRWLPYTETQAILLMPLWDPFTLRDSAQSSVNNAQDFLVDIVDSMCFITSASH